MRFLGSTAAPSCFLLFVVGCSSVVDVDEDRLGGSGIGEGGAGTVDGGGVPTREPDGGSPLPPPDSGTIPNMCEAASEARCEGDTLVVCQGGAFSGIDCQAQGAYCEGGACLDWVCEPGTEFCDAGGEAAVVCSARGDAETVSPCLEGCDEATGSCLAAPACADVSEIRIGDSVTFDLCDEDDDRTYEQGPGCGADQRASSGDRVFRLVVERPTHVEVDLRDEDDEASIDTVVYLRTACDALTSQVACDDDIPCYQSTVPGPGGCEGDVELRESRFAIFLPAGTYFLVADAFLYSLDGGRNFECGRVRLTVHLR